MSIEISILYRFHFRTLEISHSCQNQTKNYFLSVFHFTIWLLAHQNGAGSLDQNAMAGRSYRILYSVLLGTADNVICFVLRFLVSAHCQEVKKIKSYLQLTVRLRCRCNIAFPSGMSCQAYRKLLQLCSYLVKFELNMISTTVCN